MSAQGVKLLFLSGCFRILLRLTSGSPAQQRHFAHIFPIALGSVGHLATFIAALFNGNGIKKAFPQLLPVKFLLSGVFIIMLHDHILHFAVPAQHGDAVGRIKNHKVFIR